jgi:hypothetical protein
MKVRYLIRFTLLTAGFALTAAGLLAWQEIDFDLDGMWPLADELTPHPVHVMALGMALIPPTLWEIFVLENSHSGSSSAQRKHGQSSP